MGDPKKQQKKFETPRFPWRTDILQAELMLLGQYGLRNKRELWRHETTLSKFRGTARSILGMSKDEREKLKGQLLGRLNRLGVLPETAALDDVLDLTIQDILERRLQSLVFQKRLAASVYQARQFIVHGHITVGGKKVTSPSFLVPRADEPSIAFASSSSIANLDHPVRQTLAGIPETRARESTTREES